LYDPPNFLVLDEPTNHLDMLSKEVLKEALEQCSGTLIVVSHDRDFLKGLTTRTIEFRDKVLHEYHGDVEFFLGKRELDNMRAVEQQTQGKTEAAKPKVELDHETRRRLNRAIGNAERKVEKLEAELVQLEAQMGEPGFYEQPDADKILAGYERKKTELETAMEEWEAAQLELDEAEG
ncbi:MAG: ABC-F family ATP-binding cassette domain-containing protein, partial [Phaeodactylibacter sp.]|nr:ABC-F family ATP-binding cassette domain-containing protein [Phaeodactylibacter sp.]